MNLELPIINEPFPRASPVDSEPAIDPDSPHFQWGPRHPDIHLFESEESAWLFVADGCRIYNLEHAQYKRILESVTSASTGDGTVDLSAELSALEIPDIGFIDNDVPASPPLRSLSLAIAQKCNLGCTYCYAEGGDFGGVARNMSVEVAVSSVDRLLTESKTGDRVNLAFLGGEPLVNRSTLRAATEAAQQSAAKKGVDIGFSLTTNGTLLTEDDADFFERHGFAVTISLDGVGAAHDQLRSYKGGRGSYADIVQRIKPLLRKQHRMQVAARVTVTPQNMRLAETLDEFVEMGFHSVGFSPMLSSPTGRNEMGLDELDEMLKQMIECGERFEQRIRNNERYPFSNMVNALKEIHQGTHRPYPCGAGAGYMGVSADGQLFACHRFVDDPAGFLGDLSSGVDRSRQSAWLSERHVHFQEPCSQCWARYQCGGGCHHEVINRGRPACHYIRGWLHYCLQAYTRLVDTVPEHFGIAQSIDAKTLTN